MMMMNKKTGSCKVLQFKKKSEDQKSAIEKSFFDCSSPITEDYTDIPTEIIIHKNLSSRSKALMFRMLIDKPDWRLYKTYPSYLDSFEEKGGEFSRRASLAQLEDNGYILRLAYRDSKKRIIGSFIVCAEEPWKFMEIDNIISDMKREGLIATFHPRVLSRLRKKGLLSMIDIPDLINSKE